MFMMGAFWGSRCGSPDGGLRDVCSRRGLVPMHPPFLFWSCQKRNGPCTVQREKTLRRVGLRRRRPPAAGGGRLTVPLGSQGRKRAALGESFGPGKSGIHSAPIFAAAGPVVDESLRNRPMRASAPTGTRKAISPAVGADALVRPPVQAATTARGARSGYATVGGFAALWMRRTPCG